MTTARTLAASSSNGTAPPHDLDAEVSVLGAMMLSRDAILEVREELGPTGPLMFYRGAHRTIYEAALDLERHGEPVDPVTLSDRLEQRGHLDSIGGVVTLHDIVSRVPTAANARYYARIVRERAYRRLLIDFGARMQREAHDYTVDAHELVARIRDDLPSPEVARSRLLGWDELMNLREPDYLVPGHFPTGLNVIYGPSNVGKTFLALGLALSLATGKSWLGNDVLGSTPPPQREACCPHARDRHIRRGPEHGCDDCDCAGYVAAESDDDYARRVAAWTPGLPVLYVAAEGAARLPVRLKAWARDNRVDAARKFHVVETALQMRNPADVDELRQHIAAVGARVVFLDTWARTLGGNENDTSEVSEAVNVLTRLMSRYDLSVFVIHHTPADNPDRMRGNQALYAAADAVVAVRPTGVDDIEVVNEPPIGKAKDFAPFRRKLLRRKPVGDSVVLELADMYVDEHTPKGRDAAGLVLEWLADNPPQLRRDIAEKAGGDHVFSWLLDTGRIALVPGSSPKTYTLPELVDDYAVDPLAHLGRPTPDGWQGPPL